MPATPPSQVCKICFKFFLTRQLYDEHHQIHHALFYVSYPGGKTVLLRKKGGDVECDNCRKHYRNAQGLKSHYLKEHNLNVSISSKLPPREEPPLPGLASRAKDIIVQGDRQDEGEESEEDDCYEEDAMPIDVPSASIAAKGMSPDPQTDEENNWEADSSISDTPTEALIEDDEDDVVPPSFNFHTDVSRPSGDCSSFEKPLELAQRPQVKTTIGSGTVYGSDVLLYDKPLSNFGYALNEEVKVVICNGCHRGVPVDMLNSHSKIHHTGRSVLSPQEQDIVSKSLVSIGYRTSKAEKYHQAPGQKPVDGLEVLPGFCCPLQNDDGTQCARAFRAEGTFTRHLSDHPKSPGKKPDASSCSSYVQTLFNQGGLQKFFCVDPSLSNVDPSANYAYTYAVGMLESLPKPDIPIPDNDKDRASIHWFTRWPELLQPYIADRSSISFLQSLVSFPEPGSDPEWLAKLLDHGSRWWKDAEDAHINCSFRASVMLKSHEQYMGPWKVLREPESARRYCGTAISFVSFCLRTFCLPSDTIPTRFTEEQRAYLGEYKAYLASPIDSCATDVEKFQSALFCVLFREQCVDISAAGRLSCPVQSYIALLSLRKAGDFVKPGLVTQPISRLLYLARAAVLKTALRDLGDSERLTWALKELCSRYLGTGEGKTSDDLISLRKYASTLALREPGDPNIIYNPEYTVLAFQGRNLSLCRVQSGLNELIENTWAQLLALTNCKKIKVELPPSMSEDIRSTVIGDSFIKRATTDPPTLPLLFEMSQLGTFHLLRPCGRTGDKVTLDVDPGAAQEFFHVIKPIVEAIAFLVHVTSSGPLRLSEVVDDRYCNGSGPRNLLISHGFVFLLRRNLKTSAIRGCRSSVIHYPPQKVVELLIYYLAVVRPVELFLVSSLRWAEDHTNYSQFLYVVKGRKLSPQDLSSIVSRFTDQYFECRLTGSQLRHVFIDLQRVFLPPIVDPSVQKFGDSQAGHSSKVANRVYGQRIDHLPGEQASWFVLAHHWCKRLHTLLGLGPESSPIRPVPYLHAPPEPTWWRPSDYAPSQSPSTPEIMTQVHQAINSAISYATHELSMRSEKILREAVFQAISAMSARITTNQPAAQPPPPFALAALPTTPSTRDDIRFQSATPLSKALSAPAHNLSVSSNTPPVIPAQRHPPPSNFTPQPPSTTTVYNALAAQAEEKARREHAKSAKDLLEHFGGCFTCRIRDDDHRPCHPECGNSGLSGCSLHRHNIYTCTNFDHKNGWIDWKKTFRWPLGVSRCHFCGLPNDVAGYHSNGDNSYPGKCRYSDSALAAAWHILHTPHLFERLQRELGFTPGQDAKADFAIWVTSYGSAVEDIRLFSVFSWLCSQYYPSSQVVPAPSTLF